MSKLYHIRVALVVLGVLVGAGWSQITLTWDEMPAIGQSFTFYNVNDPMGQGIPVNVGNAGGPNTWEFNVSQYPNGEYYETSIVDPAGTPFSGIFSGSNYAWQQVSDSGSVYIYFDLNPAYLDVLGFAFQSQDTSITDPHEQPGRVLIFPATLNTSWTSVSVDSIDYGNGFLLVAIDTVINTIDAWGTVNLSVGSFSALRIRSDSRSTDILYFNGVPISTEHYSDIEYSWVAENIGLLAQVSSLENETNPNFTLASEVQFQTTPVGITSEPEVPISQFELFPAYPNPFNPSTHVQFRVPYRSPVRITVFSILGQPVKTLVDQEMTAGKHEVVWDGTDERGLPVSSGIYFIEMRSGAFQKVQKVVLSR